MKLGVRTPVGEKVDGSAVKAGESEEFEPHGLNFLQEDSQSHLLSEDGGEILTIYFCSSSINFQRRLKL